MAGLAVRERADAAIAQAVAVARAAGRATVDRAGQVRRADLRGQALRAWEWLSALVKRTGLTDFGVSVVVLAVTTFAVGGALAWRELTLIGVGGVAVVAVCVVYTLAHADVTARLDLSNRRLRVTPEVKVATVTVTVTNSSPANRSLRPLRILVPCGDDPWSPRTGPLAPGQSWSTTNTVPGNRRGVLTVGPVSTVRADPLGLFRHEKQVTEAEEIIVHPRTVRLEPLGSGLLRDLEGEATRTIVSHDLEFHALREYVPGDDRRHIHWRTSARTGRYMVRQFVDTRSSHLAIVVSGSMSEYANENEFETALSVGASIAARAGRDSQAVSVLAAGHTATRGARGRLLDPFSRAQWGGRRSLALRPMVEKRAGRLGGVTVGIFIAGGPLDPKLVQQAGEPLGRQVKLVGIRIGVHSGKPLVTGGLTMLNVARVEDLPRVLRALG